MIIPFLFAIMNLISYQKREYYAFKNNPVRQTEAIIIDRYGHGGGRTTKRFYLQYRFKADNVIYEHVDEVKFWVWFNYKFQDSLTIEYVVNNPKISRIHESALIEYPDRNELIRKAGKEYNRQRLEKKNSKKN